jgi:uncharacterized membrane protein
MNYAFLSGILLVLVVFSFGVKIYRNPPEINSMLSYRSHFSRKNEDTWYAANVFAGLLLMLLAVSLLILLVFLESTHREQAQILKIICGYFLVGSVLIYYLTELRLRRFFHRDGKRRSGSF